MADEQHGNGVGAFGDLTWDETLHSGVDYSTVEVVERYDSRMGAFRDIAAENQRLISALKLRSSDTVLEMGTGTGAFAIAASRVCETVHACDVSPVMLEYAAIKAGREGVSNISFHSGGFLTYQHEADPVDAAISVAALHHLPDFWKGVGLARMHRMIRPGGLFILRDVVFNCRPDEYQGAFERMLTTMPEVMRPEAITHLQREYSTFDWVMEGLLRAAGFTIESATYAHGFFAEYLCRR